MEDEGTIDNGGAALVTGGAVAPASPASTTSAKSAIQPDIELGRRRLVQSRRGCLKALDVWKHTITGSPNGYRMDNRNEQMWKTLKHMLSHLTSCLLGNVHNALN